MINTTKYGGASEAKNQSSEIEGAHSSNLLLKQPASQNSEQSISASSSQSLSSHKKVSFIHGPWHVYEYHQVDLEAIEAIETIEAIEAPKGHDLLTNTQYGSSLILLKRSEVKALSLIQQINFCIKNESRGLKLVDNIPTMNVQEWMMLKSYHFAEFSYGYNGYPEKIDDGLLYSKASLIKKLEHDIDEIEKLIEESSTQQISISPALLHKHEKNYQSIRVQIKNHKIRKKAVNLFLQIKDLFFSDMFERASHPDTIENPLKKEQTKTSQEERKNQKKSQKKLIQSLSKAIQEEEAKKDNMQCLLEAYQKLSRLVLSHQSTLEGISSKLEILEYEILTKFASYGALGEDEEPDEEEAQLMEHYNQKLESLEKKAAKKLEDMSLDIHHQIQAISKKPTSIDGTAFQEYQAILSETQEAFSITDEDGDIELDTILESSLEKIQAFLCSFNNKIIHLEQSLTAIKKVLKRLCYLKSQETEDYYSGGDSYERYEEQSEELLEELLEVLRQSPITPARIQEIQSQLQKVEETIEDSNELFSESKQRRKTLQALLVEYGHIRRSYLRNKQPIYIAIDEDR